MRSPQLSSHPPSLWGTVEESGGGPCFPRLHHSRVWRSPRVGSPLWCRPSSALPRASSWNSGLQTLHPSGTTGSCWRPRGSADHLQFLGRQWQPRVLQWGWGSVPYPGHSVTYGSFWTLETRAEHEDPSLNAESRSIFPPGSGYLAKSPIYCIWRRKNLSNFFAQTTPEYQGWYSYGLKHTPGTPMPFLERALGSLSDKPVHLEWSLQGP